MFLKNNRSYFWRVSSYILIFAGIGNNTGCPTTVTPPDNGGMVSFSSQIQPLLTIECGGCHSENGGADLAGIVLRLMADVSYDLMVNQPSIQNSSLTLVIPGNSADSLVYQKVISDTPPVGERMPLFAPNLTQSQTDLIKNWIDQGALNN